MNYEDIFSRFYVIITDSTFFNKSEDEAYSLMVEWLHSAVSEPYIRKMFSAITLDDEIMKLTYQLNDSFEDDEDSNNRLVLEVLAQYLKISWMRKQIDSALNLAVAIGGKEEKRLQSNYKTNIERADALEQKLKKDIRDHGYFNGNLSTGGV